MTIRSQHLIRIAAFAIALVSLMTVIFQSPAIGRVSAATQSVSFEVSDPTIGFSAAISTNVDWDDVQEVKKGNVAIIAYSLTSEHGTASVEVPLSILGIGLEDQTVQVPLPGIPLGSSSVSLTQYLVGMPSSIASVDLVLASSIRMLQVTSSSTSIGMLTDIDGLIWTSWGSKEVQLLTSEKGPATIHATLEYTISVGMDITILGEPYTLVPSTPILGVSGTPKLATSLSVNDDSSLALSVGIGAVATSSAIVAAFFAFRRRSKKRKSDETGGEQSL